MYAEQPASPYNTLILGVVSCAIYATLVLGFQLVYSKVRGRDPSYRRLRLHILLALWFLSNIFVWLFVSTAALLFAVVSTIGVTLILLQELYQFWRIGLVGADRRVSTGVDYQTALKLCTSSLEFIGIGAAKLTDQRNLFKDAVDRCDRAGKPIRLLLSHPDNEGLKHIALMADKDKGAYQRTVQESLAFIASQKNERHKNIQVRFYNDFPTFRLMFVNDSVCLVSHYVLGKGDGSNLPQLHVVRTPGARDIDSLWYAFSEYFESIWKRSDEWDFRSFL